MEYKGLEEVTNNKISITKFQLFFLVIESQIGIGLLSLPNVVQDSAKGDGWISIILAGIGVQLLLIIYWLLLRRFPNETFTNIIQKILGRFLGEIVSYIIYFYFIMNASLLTILTVKTINLHLLPLTPSWVISFIILSSSIYLTVSNLRIIARFFVLTSSLIIVMLGVSLLTYPIPKEVQFILPVGDSGIKEILIGINGALISMVGFEVVLFIYAFVIHNKKGMLKTISLANIFVTTIYTYFVFLCLITFSPDQLSQLRDPVLFLFRILSFRLIERIDFIFLSIWIVPMITSIIIYIFLASKSISGEENSYKKKVVINGMLIYLISLIPHRDEIINSFTQYVSYLSYTVIMVIPLILLIVSLIFKKHEMGETG